MKRLILIFLIVIYFIFSTNVIASYITDYQQYTDSFVFEKPVLSFSNNIYGKSLKCWCPPPPPPAPTPEPGTIALVSLGLFGLYKMRKKFNK